MCKWACGLTRKGHVRDKEIRHMMTVEQTSTWCARDRLRLFGNGHRREQGYVGRRVMELALPGNIYRRRGRSKRRWLDCVANDMQNSRAVSEDLHDSCRERWREVVEAYPLQRPDMDVGSASSSSSSNRVVVVVALSCDNQWTSPTQA